MNLKILNNMYGYTYLITNLINGHQYVGQHQYDKPKLDPYYFGSGDLLKQKIAQYGKKNFSIELLELCNSQKELNDAEERGIARYKTFVGWGYGGYNLTTGGEGFMVSESTKKKHSESRKKFFANPEEKRKQSERVKKAWRNPELRDNMVKPRFGRVGPWRGKKRPEETVKKMSEALKGKYVGEKSWLYGLHLSDETKKKIGEAGKGRPAWNKGVKGSNRGFWKGKHLTEETKKKLSEANKGRTPWMKGKTHTAEAKEKQRDAHLGLHHSEETRRKMSETRKDMIWINKDGKTTRIHSCDFCKYEELGYKKGRK